MDKNDQVPKSSFSLLPVNTFEKCLMFQTLVTLA